MYGTAKLRIEVKLIGCVISTETSKKMVACELTRHALKLELENEFIMHQVSNHPA